LSEGYVTLAPCSSCCVGEFENRGEFDGHVIREKGRAPRSGPVPPVNHSALYGSCK
jgi:hypothetical protein